MSYHPRFSRAELISAWTKGSHMPTLNLKDAEIFLRSAFQADIPVMIEGDPGVGKTALVQRIADSMGLPCWILQLGEVQEVDVGGFPVVTGEGATRRVERIPLGVIHEATKQAGILFLDDFRTAAPAVQGVALRLLQGKAAGDVKLHPGVAIAIAANPVDQTPGGSPLAPPIINRMLIARMRPDVSELAPFFERLGDPDSKDPSAVNLRDLGVDFSATLDRQPDLIQCEPPPQALTGEQPWASPRAWEKALRTCAVLLTQGIADTSPIFFATLSAGVGESQARAYLAIRKVREQLPSVSEICTDPANARLPGNAETYVAILGVLAQVAQRDACAAYVYAERIKADEISVVITKRLMRYGSTMTARSKFFAAAKKAQAKLQGSVSMAMSATI